MDKSFFTTFEVGEMCDVYHTTVINWINQGKLKAFVTPGGHRRIRKRDLINFMTSFQIPFPQNLQVPANKILLVDDDPSIIQLLEKSFLRSSQNLKVESTTNGVEALIRVGQNMPNLMILDVVMPSMDGFEVCQRLRSVPDTKGIKIITISGETLSSEQEGFLKNNCDAFFQKPFSPRELVQKSREILGLEESAHEAKT